MTARYHSSEFETTLDSPDWAAPLNVRVEYTLGGSGEIAELDVIRADTDAVLSLSEAQQKAIIEEIWNDVRQDEDYA